MPNILGFPANFNPVAIASPIQKLGKSTWSRVENYWNSYSDQKKNNITVAAGNLASVAACGLTLAASYAAFTATGIVTNPIMEMAARPLFDSAGDIVYVLGAKCFSTALSAGSSLLIGLTAGVAIKPIPAGVLSGIVASTFAFREMNLSSRIGTISAAAASCVVAIACDSAFRYLRSPKVPVVPIFAPAQAQYSAPVFRAEGVVDALDDYQNPAPEGIPDDSVAAPEGFAKAPPGGASFI